jgi:N-methylhydantoinase A
VPGPVCYGRGGVEPTVTDAHLALGHLPPYLLGGASRSTRGALEADPQRIAEPLGMSVEAAARGILAIVDNNMVGAIRVVSVERGHDPRDFSLLPFGGAGRCTAARWRGCSACAPSSCRRARRAVGARPARIHLKAEFARTCLQKAGPSTPAPSRVYLASSIARRAPGSTSEACRPRRAAITWHASLRYQHQGFELNVPWIFRDSTERQRPATVAAFHRLHERLYTFAQEDTPVEIVTLRVDARGVFPVPALRELPTAGPLADARVGTQSIALETGPAEAAIYARDRWAPAPASRVPPSSPSSTPRRCSCPASRRPWIASAT